LPVTGMDGSQTPWQATEALERLRDMLSPIETEFHGRLVTYPAFHYITGDREAGLSEVCRRLKQSGFRFVVIVSGETAAPPNGMEGCDLFLSEDSGATSEWHARASEQIITMWHSLPDGNL
jgi:23S rRNA (pseudouridine1915-N3)-methyltransferase